jgi:hypothetical protein
MHALPNMQNAMLESPKRYEEHIILTSACRVKNRAANVKVGEQSSSNITR